MRSNVHRDAWYGCYTQSSRALLVPAVPAHPATMAWGLARRLLTHVKAEGWLPPGGVVLDPLAGSGVTGLACSMRGIRSVLGELEAHFLAALAVTVTQYRARWQALGYPVPLMLRHDASDLPLRQVAGIISRPPLPAWCTHAITLIPRSCAQRTRDGRRRRVRWSMAPTEPRSVACVRRTRCKPAFA